MENFILLMFVDQARKTAEVHSVNLDKFFLNDPDKIDLMKVDVEGAELIVLEGARELFKQVLSLCFISTSIPLF
jgi:FkbM family methyltransferase